MGLEPLGESVLYGAKCGRLHEWSRRCVDLSTIRHFAIALCSTPAAGVLASICRDALRPDRFRTPRERRVGQKRRALSCAAGPEPRAAPACCALGASMARTHLLTRPSTMAPGFLAAFPSLGCPVCVLPKPHAFLEGKTARGGARRLRPKGARELHARKGVSA